MRSCGDMEVRVEVEEVLRGFRSINYRFDPSPKSRSKNIPIEPIWTMFMVTNYTRFSDVMFKPG